MSPYAVFTLKYQGRGHSGYLRIFRVVFAGRPIFAIYLRQLSTILVGLKHHILLQIGSKTALQKNRHRKVSFDNANCRSYLSFINLPGRHINTDMLRHLPNACSTKMLVAPGCQPAGSAADALVAPESSYHAPGCLTVANAE